MLNVTTPTLTTLYLDQAKASLMDSLNHEVPESILSPSSVEEQLQPAWFDHFWFGRALTMCGRKRLDNIQFCIEDCLAREVPGDVIECGVWRGGSAIVMRAVLAAHEVTDRTVWVADSFAGLPAPPPASVDERMYNFPQVVEIDRFAVDLATVQANFARYGLLDDQVRFLPGWFRDTLPAAPIAELAVLRLDGDYYDSTMETLVALYPKLSVGGYVIIDDWGIDQICGEKEAVLEYRQANDIDDEIIPIDYHCAFWRKSG